MSGEPERPMTTPSDTAKAATCARCGIDLDSGADCGNEPYPCLGSESEMEAEYGE